LSTVGEKCKRTYESGTRGGARRRQAVRRGLGRALGKVPFAAQSEAFFLRQGWVMEFVKDETAS
jgi:hypothetical protein